MTGKVKQFWYLGYTLQRNRGQETYMRERIRNTVKKGRTIMGLIWVIEKKR